MAIDLNIVIGGAAGQGVHTITGLLAKILVRQGCRVLVVQDYQSRVRGGHLFNRIRVSDQPVASSREGIDLLVALNQETILLHRGELSPDAIIIYDAAVVKELPAGVSTLALTAGDLLPEQQAAEVAINAGASGALLGLLKAPLPPLMAMLLETFGAKGAEVVGWNHQAAAAGYRLGSAMNNSYSLAGITPPPQPRLLISGHEAVAVGALAAGLQLICGYPMTPWSSVLNAIGQRADKFGGVVVEQAEDEIAAINLAIGASYAGVRAMTGSSGGGFALMVEALGLAGCAEIPLVILESQRPGPSTGLPTRTEQGDLSFVLSAGQGDFPRAVLAPGNAAQGFALTARAFNLADRYQLPVIVVTDQYFGDTSFTQEPGDFPGEVEVERAIDTGPVDGVYERYALTPSGISPRRLPGFGPVVAADSDEHTPDGHLTEDLAVRVQMHDKRLRKLAGLAQELDGITTIGPDDAPLTLACWGSSLGPVTEAVARLNAASTPARMVHCSELWPFPAQAAARALGRPQRLVMVEMNATGQFNRLLRQETGISADHLVLKYDGAPLTPEYILRALAGHA